MQVTEVNGESKHRLDSTEERSAALFAEHHQVIFKRTDRFFASLMVLQWITGILFALWVSPKTWAGSSSQTHIHVYAAVFLGGLITGFPAVLALVWPGRVLTRHAVAVGQMLVSALFIHLTGGRIDTHFHVFGSLAFLTFYRDWRVLVSATVVVALLFGFLYWAHVVVIPAAMAGFFTFVLYGFMRSLPQEILNYEGPGRQLKTQVENVIPTMTALLNEKIAVLEQYQKLG